MTRVAFLWHMHQPFYQDLLTGEHVLPWVRLHALKDYWGMVAILREFPGLKATFNLVPSLLVQLEAFARDEARDRHLELGLKPATALSEDERAFCVEQFFHAHAPRMIDPYPRYRQLFDQRASTGVGLSARSQASHFSVDDLRDLQVWHKLVWLDADYHEHDKRVRELVAKGRGFTEDDKVTLRAIELELLRKVIPEYAAAAARGQIELSASPFYHPILPLLCDTDVYLRTHPYSRMPREPFRHPEDAAEQLSRAVALHERLFGRRPAGLWPSEGSVSDAIVPLASQAGFAWMATDEEILARSIGVRFSRNADGHVDHAGALYRAYRLGRDGGHVACGFRDHALSDLIGFSYASWSAEGAADDFVHRLVTAGRRYRAQTQGAEATVFVILDGENAWEYYDGQGRPFLRALYGRLQDHPELRTVTMSEACAGPTEELPSIFPGSWINGDFYIWIGHPDDHRAWSQLVDARRALDAASSSPTSRQALSRAREEILIAEGSDWFWWYGDDHSSEHDLAFDELFRRHVRNVYRALDQPIPEELFVTNISTAPPAVRIERPSGFIHPTIDGETTSYFEWVGAGCVDAADTAGAMHQVTDRAPIVTAVEFGVDLGHLFVRVDGTGSLVQQLESGVELRVKFLTPPGMQVLLRGDPHGPVTARLESRLADGAWHTRECPGLTAAAATIVELQVPFDCLGVRTHDTVAFLVSVARQGAEVERHPRHGPIEIEVPDQEFAARNWTV
jgi:alpha-amylase/alpha-mannosidase (GH57 family)